VDVKTAKKIGFLSQMADGELQALLADARRRPFRKGEPVILQGGFNASLYLVQDGVLHVRRKAGGHETMLGRLEPGSFFGEMSLFDPGPTSAEVVGVQPGTLIEVSRDHLDRFLESRPAAGRVLLTGVLAEMSKRLRAADERLADAAHWAGMLR
jgi:CRP-like cAMP-binding protein